MNAMEFASNHNCTGWNRYVNVFETDDDPEQILSTNAHFDYIYLRAHGNSEGFASEDGHVKMSWKKLAMLLCNSKCMNEDSILMLSCCRGGLMEIAYDIFLTYLQIC